MRIHTVGIRTAQDGIAAGDPNAYIPTKALETTTGKSDSHLNTRLLGINVQVPVNHPVLSISLLQPIIRLLKMTTVKLVHKTSY